MSRASWSQQDRHRWYLKHAGQVIATARKDGDRWAWQVFPTADTDAAEGREPDFEAARLAVSRHLTAPAKPT